MVLIELLIERWHTFERLVAIATKSRVSITLRVCVCAAGCCCRVLLRVLRPVPATGSEKEISLSVFH